MTLIAAHLLAAYRQALVLKRLPRTGWLQHGVPMPESVAAHCYGVALLALLVGDQITGIDRERLLRIALLHDLAEATLTDLPASTTRLIGKQAKRAAEAQALAELVADLPASADYQQLLREYEDGASIEARLVKALDRIELLAQALAYEQAGQRGLDQFWNGANEGWQEFPLIGELAAGLLAERTIAMNEGERIFHPRNNT